MPPEGNGKISRADAIPEVTSVASWSSPALMLIEWVAPQSDITWCGKSQARVEVRTPRRKAHTASLRAAGRCAAHHLRSLRVLTGKSSVALDGTEC